MPLFLLIYLAMKIKFILLFSLLCFTASSQTDIKFGIRVEAAHNLISNSDDHLTSYRPIVSVDFSKIQVYGGPVFSHVSEIKVPSGWFSWNSGTKSKNGLTGGLIGGRYYLKNSKKTRVYNFFETMVLYYTTCESVVDNYNYPYGKPGLDLVDDANGKNKTFFIQPTAGAGVEYIFFDRLFLTIEAGIGYSFRSLVYESDFYPVPSYYNYGRRFEESLEGVGVQVKLGAGFNF
jgi:hypothetical protein